MGDQPAIQRQPPEAADLLHEREQRLLGRTAEGSLELTWRHTLAIAQASDRAGFEALVPLGRWRGYCGVTNFNGRSFEG